MFDLAWWHGFNFKWQKGSVVMYLRIDKSINVQTFYSGLPFQHWSIHYQPDLTNIKSEIKDFVYNFTNDTVYYKTKIKHPSSTLYYAVPASAALTSNFDKIQQKDGLYQYIVMLPDLKLYSKVILREECNNYENKKFKLYLFHNEEKFKRKIRLQLL
jgi:hypothetical protein